MNKKNLIISIIVFSISVLFYSCAGSSNQTNENANSQKQDSVYVFDQVPVPKDTIEEQPKATPPVMNAKYYVVQIGAFTTKDKADTFANRAKKELNYKIEISYSGTVNLYVVQLNPPYNTKIEAEKVRNSLWKMNHYKDAWILTVTR